MLSIGGIICNFTPILSYFKHRGDEKGLHRNLKSFCPQNQVKTKQQNKKRPNIIQRSNAYHSQIIGGDISPRVPVPLTTRYDDDVGVGLDLEAKFSQAA